MDSDFVMCMLSVSGPVSVNVSACWFCLIHWIVL